MTVSEARHAAAMTPPGFGSARYRRDPLPASERFAAVTTHAQPTIGVQLP